MSGNTLTSSKYLKFPTIPTESIAHSSDLFSGLAQKGSAPTTQNILSTKKWMVFGCLHAR